MTLTVYHIGRLSSDGLKLNQNISEKVCRLYHQWQLWQFPFLSYMQKPMHVGRMERQTTSTKALWNGASQRWAYLDGAVTIVVNPIWRLNFTFQEHGHNGIEEQRRCRAKQTTQASLSHRISQRNVYFDDWRLRENKPRGLCRSLALFRFVPSIHVACYFSLYAHEYLRKPHRKSRKRKKVRVRLHASQTDQSSQNVSPGVRFCPEVVDRLVYLSVHTCSETNSQKSSAALLRRIRISVLWRIN